MKRLSFFPALLWLCFAEQSLAASCSEDQIKTAVNDFITSMNSKMVESRHNLEAKNASFYLEKQQEDSDNPNNIAFVVEYELALAPLAIASAYSYEEEYEGLPRSDHYFATIRLVNCRYEQQIGDAVSSTTLIIDASGDAKELIQVGNDQLKN